VDKRISAACSSANSGLRYSRFVDDITISGPFDLKASGFSKLVQSVVEDDGFALNSKKNTFGRRGDVPITSIREVRGHLDVKKEYVYELERQLEDAKSLATGGSFSGPYYSQQQILGRIQYIVWINRNRRTNLLRQYRAVPWSKVTAEAAARGLISTKKTLMRVE